jgi:hypothetical protein
MSSSSQPDSSETPLPLPEPSKDANTTTIDMSTGGSTVNKDGTLSRISNWGEMSEIERQNTLRILGKRNQLRRETLQQAEEKAEKKEE